MQPSTLYQGHQFNPAQAPGGKVSTTLPFADEWNKNMQATTENLQALESALIERNDNTVLLNQQAEARNNDLQMTLELKQMLEKPDGEGGFYNANSQVDKVAVRDFVNKYVNLSRKWDKALLSPEAKMKSAASTDAYRFGVVKAVETALLANTKARQKKAFEDNIKLADRMRDWNGKAELTRKAIDDDVISSAEGNLLLFDNRAARVADDVNNAVSLDSAMDLMENEEWLADAEYYNPDALAALKSNIQRLSKTSGRETTFVEQTNSKTGKKELVKAPPEPPIEAPWYYQKHFMKHGGKFNTPEAQNGSFAVMQRYASENITELKGTPEGDNQWADMLAMGEKCGLDTTTINQIYNTRSSQISYGGFDPKAYLNAISDETWLHNTTRDESILADEDLTDAKKAEALRNIIKEMKDSVLTSYNLWYTQNESHKPAPRAQAAEFEKHLQQMLKDSPDIFHAVTSQVENNILQQEIAIDKEKRNTLKRKQQTNYENLWLRNKGIGLLRKLGINTEMINASAPGVNVSKNLTLDWELGRSSSAANEPGYKDEFIIYVPEKVKTSFSEITLPTGDRKCTTFKIQNANIEKPALSRKARIALGQATRNPDRITWDGQKLSFSDREVESSPNIVYGLFPEDDIADDGLAPENYTEEELNLY